MSKSQGSVYFLKDIIDRGIDPLVLRYFLLQAHYRSKQNFTWEALKASEVAYNKLKKQVAILSDSQQSISIEINNTNKTEAYKNKFLTAINNDFNTPQALAILWTLIKDKEIDSKDKLDLIYDFDKVLGVL